MQKDGRTMEKIGDEEERRLCVKEKKRKNNREQQKGEDRENVVAWVLREPPRPPVQSLFVVKSLAGGLSPTWLSENNKLLW